MTTIHEDVQDYYGQQLQQSSDLKTDACCSKATVPSFIKDILKKIHPEVLARYYGCGLVFPPKLQGCRVLDLGSGAGRDVYILSSLVGDQGYVVGVDMTKEQLDVANRFIDYHTKQFGLSKPNVEFHLGKIEELTDDAQLKTNSFDVVVSNCVVNLSPDKKKVLQQVYEMLKPGGEFYFSDVYADRPVPEELRQNKILWGECLSGALCESDLISSALEIGFTRPILVTQESIGVSNKDLEKLIGDIKFTSCTYRLFKNKSIEDSSIPDPQLGTLVTYQTPITDDENEFQLDQSITFELNGQPQYLNTDLTNILRNSRYTNHFKFDPVTDEKQIPNSANQSSSSSSCCSCRPGTC
jgi:arsenite methyltransferase